MAHPKRAQYAETLAVQLDASITWDRIGSRWDTGRRAWLSVADSDDEWGMVIQDDAILPRGFHSALPRALARVDGPVCLYAGKVSPWAQEFAKVPRSTSFLAMPGIWWGVGVCLPTRLIKAAVELGDTNPLTQYDHNLGRGFTTVYYTWPSLVEHRDGPSLVKGRGGGRHAFYYRENVSRIRFDGRITPMLPPVPEI